MEIWRTTSSNSSQRAGWYWLVLAGAGWCWLVLAGTGTGGSHNEAELLDADGSET
jgi:hypothetical protein